MARQNCRLGLSLDGGSASIRGVDPLRDATEGSPQRADGRVRRGLAAADAIELAALGLFVEHGFDNTTAEDIAAAAGVSVRTFFRHFPNGKQGVMLLGTRRHVDILEQALRRRPPQEPALKAMREAVRETYREINDPDHRCGHEQTSKVYDQIAVKQPDLIARMMGERQLMMEALVEPIALRMSLDPDTDVRPRLLVHSVHAAIIVAWLMGLQNNNVDRSELVEAALDAFEQGMARSMATATVEPSIDL
jgi:AcrR family transcriptional regulator